MTAVDDYRAWYDRGWRYSHRDTATLDYGDQQGFPDAWYDGYMDHAVGREKWHGPDGPRLAIRPHGSTIYLEVR